MENHPKTLLAKITGSSLDKQLRIVLRQRRVFLLESILLEVEDPQERET